MYGNKSVILIHYCTENCLKKLTAFIEPDFLVLWSEKKPSLDPNLNLNQSFQHSDKKNMIKTQSHSLLRAHN